jgi:hypothetical protein
LTSDQVTTQRRNKSSCESNVAEADREFQIPQILCLPGSNKYVKQRKAQAQQNSDLRAGPNCSLQPSNQTHGTVPAGPRESGAPLNPSPSIPTQLTALSAASMEDTAVEEAEVSGAAEFAPALVAAHPQGHSVAVAVGPELRVFDLK